MSRVLIAISIAFGYHAYGFDGRAVLAGPLFHTKQTTLFSCGHSCLNSALLYWGKHSPGEGALIQQMGSTYYNPPSPEALAAKAREFGLYASPEYMTLE